MIGTYSPVLVGLSIIAAIAASYVAFALAAHISRTRGWAGAYWLAGGAVALGTGIWSMHFIGMLAYQLPIPMAYDLGMTFASLLIAIVVSGFALHIVSSGEPSLRTFATGALALGVGIALMHYVGVAAMNVRPPITFDSTLVALSVLVAVAASAVALVLAFRLRSASAANRIWQRLLAAVAMGLGICAMHYTGMAAAHIAPDAICATPMLPIDQHWLAIIIAGTTFLFLGATMLILTIDVRLAHQLGEANARIAALAREDPLTGLANRRTFLEHLDVAYRTRSRSKADFAVLFLDLDGFKDINDTLGHPAGDALIVTIAQRLKSVVRNDDLVARFGGDEFAILQRNLTTPADAGTLAEKVRTAVADPVSIGQDDVGVTASIGIAMVTDRTAAPSDLMVQADLALYRCKDDGRNCYRFHDPALDRQVHLRTLLARELQTAIERGEFEILYRPQVHIAARNIVGLKTQVRWNHPSRGAISQQTFLPIAERAGAIRALSDWVVDEACAQLRRWCDHGVAPAVLGIDVFGSRRKTADDFSAQITGAIDKHGIDAGSIVLDFDEATFMDVSHRCPSVLRKLRERGFRLAVTDFGSGYSSIFHLAKTPVQRLVIPRAMVVDALHGVASERAIRAIVHIAHEIGADIVADGVETQPQAMFLLAAGCECAQGPLYYPWLSAMETTQLLRRDAENKQSAQGRSFSAA